MEEEAKSHIKAEEHNSACWTFCSVFIHQASKCFLTLSPIPRACAELALLWVHSLTVKRKRELKIVTVLAVWMATVSAYPELGDRMSRYSGVV